MVGILALAFAVVVLHKSHTLPHLEHNELGQHRQIASPSGRFAATLIFREADNLVCVVAQDCESGEGTSLSTVRIADFRACYWGENDEVIIYTRDGAQKSYVLEWRSQNRAKANGADGRGSPPTETGTISEPAAHVAPVAPSRD